MIKQTKIEQNTADALKVMAAAADLAIQKIALVQAVALKSSNGDHDELVKLIQSVEDFHDETRRTLESLRNDYHGKISDHERRISICESSGKAQHWMLGTIILIGSFLAALLIYHISGGKPL